MPPTDCAIYHDMVHPDEEKGTNKSKGKQNKNRQTPQKQNACSYLLENVERGKGSRNIKLD